MISRIRTSFRRDGGASAVEYAILIAAIAAIIVAIVFVLGGRVKSSFSKTNSCVSVQGQDAACGGTQARDDDDDDEDEDEEEEEEEEEDCGWERVRGQWRWVCN